MGSETAETQVGSSGPGSAPWSGLLMGSHKDIVAVTAAVETEGSNGQTEGQINRLKAIKRQLCGRAGFAYLRARVLPSPVLTTSASVNSS